MELRVDGMTCEGCVKAVTKAVQRIAPDARVDIDLAAGTVTIDAAVPSGQFAAAIEAAGFAVTSQEA
jgi:copper chaperone